VKWWLTAWQLARDILLTGTGLFLIVSQVGAREPSSTLIVAGLALIVPAAATHATAVLSGPSAPAHGPSESSPSSSPPSSSPPSRHPEGTDEHAG
jgi:hypothetical protein